jgi:hypothetical protein
MSEKDPYAQKRKDSSDESRMDDERMNNDTHPDISGSSRNPKDDIDPIRPRANLPDKDSDEETDDEL